MSASPFPLRLLKRMSEPSAPAYKSTSSTIQNTEVTVKQGDITKETVSDSITQTLLYFIWFEFLYLIIKSFIYALLVLQFKLFPFKFKYTFLNNGYIFKSCTFFIFYWTPINCILNFLSFVELLVIVYRIESLVTKYPFKADVIVNVVGPDLDFQKSVISKFICKAGGSALVKVCILYN